MRGEPKNCGLSLFLSGEVIWDTSKPDGTPRKLMDVSKHDTANMVSFSDQPLLMRMVYAEYAGSNID